MFSRLANLSILLTIILLCCVCSVFGQNKAASASGPSISLDAESHNFGLVEEGVELKHTFKISNVGSAVLQLHDPYSSCGCTVPTLTKHRLKPGEQTDLVVVVDTAMKQNKVIKTVYLSSNDPRRATVPIYLSMNVKDPHIGMTGDVGIKIFNDQRCAGCHVAKGIGVYGNELYQADCAMCHGKKAQGAVGPELIGPYDNEVFKNNVEQVISYGSKTHRSMPGFLAQAGGPLSKEQIDSIMKYLSALSKGKE